MALTAYRVHDLAFGNSIGDAEGVALVKPDELGQGRVDDARDPFLQVFFEYAPAVVLQRPPVEGGNRDAETMRAERPKVCE